jgi:hypothetical protein
MTIPANFSAKNGESYINAQWWIEIDGLRLRYGTTTPSWSPTDTTTNRTIKDYMSDIIQCRAQRVEPLNGKTTSHGLTISLIDVGDDITELFSVHDNTNKAWTTATSNCTASATTLHVTATSAFTTPCELYVGGETMWAPTKTTLTFHVHRAQYGSIADDHKITDDAGNTQTVEVWNAPRYIVGRGITLYENRAELVEADAIKMRCVVDTVAEKNGIWTIGASGHLSKLATQINRKPANGILASRIFDSGSRMHFVRDVQGTFVTATAGTKEPWISVGDTIAAYRSFALDSVVHAAADGYYLVDMVAVPDMNGLDTPVGGMGSMSNPGAEEDPVVQLCSHVLFKDGASDYTDPLSVLLCLLLSKKGDKTNHATYDILPDGMGIGWPSAWVDVSGIEALRSSTGLGMVKLKFVIEESEDAKKWIEENLLRPNMLFMVENWDGTVTVKNLLTRNQAIVEGSDFDITESVLLEVPELSISNFPIGEITWKINHDPIEDDFMAELKVIFDESVRRYHANARKYELECKTVHDPRFGKTGKVWRATEYNTMPVMIGQYIATMWDRFAVNPVPILSAEVPYNYLTSSIPGNVCRVTSTITPNLRNSVRGYTQEWFQIIESQPSPKTSSVKLVLWQIGVHDLNSARYAPSARVLSNTDSHGIPPKCLISLTTSVYYTHAADGGDAHQFTTGDKVHFYNSLYVSRDSRSYTISTTPASGVKTLYLSETSLKFSASSGDIMETESWDSASTYQKDYWGYQSDTSNKLGGSNDEGKQRT